MVDPATEPAHCREPQADLALDHADQTLAVYPANLAPHPWPFPFPMDCEKGIETYQTLITAKEYQRRIDAGDDMPTDHKYTVFGASPVIRVEIAKAEKLSGDVTKYEMSSLGGAPLPEWTAGAHFDIVVTPEYFRQYSSSGDPADRTKYQIAILREDEGRGGSKLLHRILSHGCKIFVSKPINHFPLAGDGTKHVLMGGGIGITPMVAFAHECHAKGMDFALHYLAITQVDAWFLKDLRGVGWADKVTCHISDHGTRADLDALLSGYQTGWHIYTCRPDCYMNAVMNATTRHGFPEDARHLEYFFIPEMPDYENHLFTPKFSKSGQTLAVPADKSAAEILIENGHPVDLKCADGICGVCKCGPVDGDVEHRDFVLSNAQRPTSKRDHLMPVPRRNQKRRDRD